MALEADKSVSLADVNFDLGPSETLVVAGQIGSGKTTLLYSIMDETNKCGGTQSVRGKIAYVEQEPFIISASIKENIT